MEEIYYLWTIPIVAWQYYMKEPDRRQLSDSLLTIERWEAEHPNEHDCMDEERWADVLGLANRLTLIKEDSNKSDPQAVVAYIGEVKIGYVARHYARFVRYLMHGDWQIEMPIHSVAQNLKTLYVVHPYEEDDEEALWEMGSLELPTVDLLLSLPKAINMAIKLRLENIENQLDNALRQANRYDLLVVANSFLKDYPTTLSLTEDWLCLRIAHACRRAAKMAGPEREQLKNIYAELSKRQNHLIKPVVINGIYRRSRTEANRRLKQDGYYERIDVLREQGRDDELRCQVEEWFDRLPPQLYLAKTGSSEQPRNLFYARLHIEDYDRWLLMCMVREYLHKHQGHLTIEKRAREAHLFAPGAPHSGQVSFHNTLRNRFAKHASYRLVPDLVEWVIEMEQKGVVAKNLGGTPSAFAEGLRDRLVAKGGHTYNIDNFCKEYRRQKRAGNRLNDSH